MRATKASRGAKASEKARLVEASAADEEGGLAMAVEAVDAVSVAVEAVEAVEAVMAGASQV